MLSKELVAASTVPLVLSVLAEGETLSPGLVAGAYGTETSCRSAVSKKDRSTVSWPQSLPTPPDKPANAAWHREHRQG
jgi:hypothetical protein